MPNAFRSHPEIQTPSRFSISTTPQDDGPVTVISALLLGMAGAVLLIASLNLANMLLARGTSRTKEMGGSTATFFTSMVKLAESPAAWTVTGQEPSAFGAK